MNVSESTMAAVTHTVTNRIPLGVDKVFLILILFRWSGIKNRDPFHI